MTFLHQCEIARNYSCNQTKSRYLTTYGLATHFTYLLGKKIQGKEFVLLFDKGLNKKTKKNGYIVMFL